VQTSLLRFVACVDLLKQFVQRLVALKVTKAYSKGPQQIEVMMFEHYSVRSRSRIGKKASARRAVKISSAADVFIITGGRVTATPSSRTNRIIKVKLG